MFEHKALPFYIPEPRNDYRDSKTEVMSDWEIRSSGCAVTVCAVSSSCWLRVLNDYILPGPVHLPRNFISDLPC